MEDGKPAVASSADASPADDTPGGGRAFRRWVAAAVAVGHRDVAVLGALRQAVVKAARVWPSLAAGCPDVPVLLASSAMAVVRLGVELASLPQAGACLAGLAEPPAFGLGGPVLQQGDRPLGGWDDRLKGGSDDPRQGDQVDRERGALPDEIWRHVAFDAAAP